MIARHMLTPLLKKKRAYKVYQCDLKNKNMIGPALVGQGDAIYLDAFILNVDPTIFTDFIEELTNNVDAPAFDKVIVPINADNFSSRDTLQTFYHLIAAGIDMSTVYVIFTNVKDESEFDANFVVENKAFLNSLFNLEVTLIATPILKSDIYQKLDAKKNDNYVVCNLGNVKADYFKKILADAYEKNDYVEIQDAMMKCDLYVASRDAASALNVIFKSIFN